VKDITPSEKYNPIGKSKIFEQFFWPRVHSPENQIVIQVQPACAVRLTIGKPAAGA
jgi:hypothetical protein